MFTSSTQLQNRSFSRRGKNENVYKCPKMKNARAKRAKVKVFIVKYANLKKIIDKSVDHGLNQTRLLVK